VPSHSRRIRSVAARALDVPLTTPFGIAGGVQTVAANVLVVVTLEDGTEGYGEAAPLPAYNGETQAGTLAALKQAGPALVGTDAGAWRALARLLRDLIGTTGAARCALETAALDAHLKQAGLPLSTFFGGAGGDLETDVTITTGSAEEARNGAELWSARGFRKFKIKVGAGELEADVERVRAVARAAPRATITLDANASLTSDVAIGLVHRLRASGVELALFEQPTTAGDWAELGRVARHVTVAADENVVTAADALDAAKLGSPHVINIKLMKAGIAEALDVAAIARAAGLGLMIGGNVESLLAMTVSAHFAAGLGGFEHVDLDTPLFFAENPFLGGFELSGPRIRIPTAAGHGVRKA
jgi:L-Ala-D/L-Glu epimerase